MEQQMAVDGASGALGAMGLKSAVAGVAGAAFMSILAIVIGFTVVPLAPGKEQADAVRRLACGLLASFTVGPLAAIKFLEWQPTVLVFWLKLVGHENQVWAYLAAATPFIALTAIAGFWLVAGVMHWFAKRADKDIGEMATDAVKTAKDVIS